MSDSEYQKPRRCGCGGRAILHESTRRGVRVKCEKSICPTSTPYYETFEEAENAWDLLFPAPALEF